MAVYHINPETGNVGACRAKKQCRFGGAHYTDKQEALQKAEAVAEYIANRKKAEKEMTEEVKPSGMFNISAPEIGVYFNSTFTPFSEKAQHAAELWAEMRNTHPELEDWRMYISSYNTGATRSIAFTNALAKTLVIDDRWINALTEDETKDILTHELAHALTGGQGEKGGHGKKWQEKFKSLGGSGQHELGPEATVRALHQIQAHADKNNYPALAQHPDLKTGPTVSKDSEKWF